MKKYRSKYRIHTFVFKKKLYYFLLWTVVTTLVIWVCLYPAKHEKEDVYKSIGRLCIDNVMMHGSDRKTHSHKKINLSHKDLMRQASAIFTNGISSESDTAAKKEGIHAQGSVVKEVKEKSVQSRNVEIKNETDYAIDKDKLIASEKNYSAKGQNPKVLIVHTHGCETYSDINGTGLGADGSYRTLDTEKNMVKIGKAIAEVFKSNGINVIHDTTLCDYPAYNSSYVKSLGVIEWYMERYPEIEFVFDIHRDAIEDENGIPTKLTANVGGKKCAQAMIVCGTDASGLYNPNWRENLTLALKIQKNTESIYPGLMRPVNLRRERFNMHKTKGSLLFEVGTHGNTLEEALYAAEYLAAGIALTIAN